MGTWVEEDFFLVNKRPNSSARTSNSMPIGKCSISRVETGRKTSPCPAGHPLAASRPMWARWPRRQLRPTRRLL